MFFGLDVEHPAHTVVTDAAKLRALNLELTRFQSGEAHFELHSGNGVLFHTHVGQIKTVNDVFRRQNDFNRFIHGNIQLVDGDDVVFPVRIAFAVDAHGICPIN